MYKWVASSALVLAMHGLSGCSVPFEPTLNSDDVRWPSAAQKERGLIWMFPGLLSPPWELAPAYRALRDEGVEQAVQIFEWPWRDFLSRSADVESNEAKIAQTVSAIVAYRAEYPDAPIDLVGYSAGAYLALRTVESLPRSVRVRSLVLAQPDVSIDYDLSFALARLDGQIVCYYCPRDWFVPTVVRGTIGTMDRAFTRSAGQFGFDAEDAVPDQTQRARLVQIGWDEAWQAAGHAGTHIEMLEYDWNRAFVAPLLVTTEAAESP